MLLDFLAQYGPWALLLIPASLISAQVRTAFRNFLKAIPCALVSTFTREWKKTVLESSNIVSEELQPNAGSSLKDQITQILAELAVIKSNQTAMQTDINELKEQEHRQDQDFLQYRKEQLKNQHTQNQKPDII